ncbi:hypothetical protein GCM10023320_24020 [Pseudonocardia adelaidensis]|uniref:Uncharacterized protein n=1 Tax=Pseudonocardia adelaidensis TaxID=648754 RepID=A0ABP9NGH3_9PSEU
MQMVLDEYHAFASVQGHSSTVDERLREEEATVGPEALRLLWFFGHADPGRHTLGEGGDHIRQLPADSGQSLWCDRLSKFRVVLPTQVQDDRIAAAVAARVVQGFQLERDRHAIQAIGKDPDEHDRFTRVGVPIYSDRAGFVGQRFVTERDVVSGRTVE